MSDTTRVLRPDGETFHVRFTESTNKFFWTMCQCGRQFYGFGNKGTDRARKQSDRHMKSCRLSTRGA